MVSVTHVLLISVLLLQLPDNDVRAYERFRRFCNRIIQAMTRTYRSDEQVAEQIEQPTVNQQNSPAVDEPVEQAHQTIETGIIVTNLKHVYWRGKVERIGDIHCNSNVEDADNDMYQSAGENLYAFKGLTESFLWHFAHIISAEENLNRCVEDYALIFDIYTGATVWKGRTFSVKENRKITGEFRMLLLSGCTHILSVISEMEWIRDYHAKALRGLVWGNKSVMDLAKRNVAWDQIPYTPIPREVYCGCKIRNRINVLITAVPLPTCKQFMIRIATFLAALKNPHFKMELTKRYWQHVEEILVRLGWFVAPKAIEPVLKETRETAGANFQYLKKSASWLLKNIAEDYFYNQVINERTANDQHRLKYRAFFALSIEYADMIMYLIDTEPMKRILTNVYKVAAIDLDQLKKSTINFVVRFTAIISDNKINADVQLYINHLKNVCIVPFCDASYDGYPEFWMPNRTMMKFATLSKAIMNKIPSALWSRENISKHFKSLKDLMNEQELYVMFMPKEVLSKIVAMELKLIRRMIKRTKNQPVEET